MCMSNYITKALQKNGKIEGPLNAFRIYIYLKSTMQKILCNKTYSEIKFQKYNLQ